MSYGGDDRIRLTGRRAMSNQGGQDKEKDERKPTLREGGEERRGRGREGRRLGVG